MSATRLLPVVACLLAFGAGSVQSAPRAVTFPLHGCVNRRLTLGAGQLRLMDTKRRTVLYSYTDSGLRGDLAVQTSPACCLFAVRDPDRLLQVVSAETGAVLKALPAEAGADTATLAFGPDACFAALTEREAAGARMLSLISGETGAVVATLPGLRNLDLRFGPRGDALGLWERSRSFSIVSGETGAVRFHDPEFDLSQAEASVEVSADCSLFRLIEASEADPVRRSIRVIDGDTGQTLSRIAPEEAEAVPPHSRLLTYPVDLTAAGTAQWSVEDPGTGLTMLETGGGEGAQISGAEVEPRTKDPVLFTVAPERVNVPFRAEATAIDAAGNCRHCLVIGSAVRTSRSRAVVTQTFRNVPPSHGEVLLLNGTPGAWLVQVTANRRSFRTVLQDGQRRTLDIAAGLTKPQNTVSIRVLGRPGSGVNVLLQEPTGL